MNFILKFTKVCCIRNRIENEQKVREAIVQKEQAERKLKE